MTISYDEFAAGFAQAAKPPSAEPVTPPSDDKQHWVGENWDVAIALMRNGGTVVLSIRGVKAWGHYVIESETASFREKLNRLLSDRSGFMYLRGAFDSHLDISGRGQDYQLTLGNGMSGRNQQGWRLPIELSILRAIREALDDQGRSSGS